MGAVVNFSQQSSTNKSLGEKPGDEGLANNSSSNQKTAPMASMASFATGSGRGFGRPDLVNDSQVNIQTKGHVKLQLNHIFRLAFISHGINAS